ncbi:MAG: hypothetical protein HFJ28_01730 [Clostridia bacterium]|jgi:NTE family protein|nr:hypothetical protein [Clostridia bacterium]
MKIGLALSGGGVKGAGHIGAIKALEENNIKISAVSGTSIGSIVASLYAMGYNADEMIKLFHYFAKNMLKTDPKYFVSNIRSTKSLFGSGMISGEAIEEAINECAKLKGISNIQEIKMPIAIPTVDVKTGKEYVFTNRDIPYIMKKDEGSGEYIARPSEKYTKYITDIEIGKAVRASCSYPGVFSPTSYKEYRFIDGGILDNVPTEELKELGVDKLLTIKFPPKEIENPRTAVSIVFRSLDIIFHDRDTQKTKMSDYIIDLNVVSSSTFDIKKIDSCYEAGYQKTLQELETIKKCLEIEENS